MDEFKFEDGFISARELAQRVTAYKEAALQTALENGCQTMEQLMGWLARRDAAKSAHHRSYSRRGAQSTDRLVKKFGRGLLS